MYKTIVMIFFVLLSSCDTRTGNNSPYIIATRIDTVAGKRRSEGSGIFQRKCTSCHNLVHESTGPALFKSGMENRDTTWLQALLTDHRYLHKDSLYKARVKQYGMSCPEQAISPEEVKSVYEYIRNPSNGCAIYQ